MAINRNARNMETSRVATIGTGNTVTCAVADSTTGRDMADRWIQATLQETGDSLLTLNRSFDGCRSPLHPVGSRLHLRQLGDLHLRPRHWPDRAADSLPLLAGRHCAAGTVSAATPTTPTSASPATPSTAWPAPIPSTPLGNLKTDQEGSTTTTFSYNSANQLTQSVVGSATTVYGWDTTNAWRTSQGPSANPTQIQYSYNAQGRMATYANSATSTSATYTYDAAGQRTKSAVTVSGTTTTTNWVYDGLTLMSLSATQGSSSWRVDYLYDEDGAPYGGVYRSPATSTSPTYFAMITNDRGDVVELLDANGNAFAAYHYDAWGLPQGSGNGI